MNQLFEPKGECSQWVVLYDAIKELPYGEKLSFVKLNNICGFDVKAKRSVIYRANKELLMNNRRMLLSERNYGYKIGEPSEQYVHGAQRKTRAGRQLRKGILEVENLDIEKLSPEERINRVHLLNHLLTSASIVRGKQKKAIEVTKKAVVCQEDALNDVNKMMGELMILKSKLSGESITVN